MREYLQQYNLLIEGKMITVEIFESSNELMLGEYQYYFDTIFIGSSKKADIIFAEDNLPSKFLSITFLKDQLFVTNEENSMFYFVNNKKMSGARKLMIGDNITINSHKIKILDFKKNSTKSLENYYEDFQKNHSELQFALDFIEEKLIELETNSPVNK
jgi:hypothetical protein